MERFHAKELDASQDTEFEVVLARSGQSLIVPPGKSIFHAVEELGIPVLGSCHEGVCGTCETVVLEGEVDHRDVILSDSEKEANETMMVCVSRCRGSRLVIDL